MVIDYERIVLQLSILQLYPGLYEGEVAYQGHPLDVRASGPSICAVIEHLAEDMNVAGFEVFYAGFAIGTFTAEYARSSAGSVAQDAVETVAAIEAALGR